MNKGDSKYYQIGEISKICNIPIRTLHYYDEIGILKPNRVNEDSNYRYYTNEQINTINTIKHLKTAGFSLKEIRLLLNKKDVETNKTLLHNRCSEIEKKITELSILSGRLKEYLNFYNDNEDKTTGIEIKHIPETYVAYVRYKGQCSPEEFRLRFSKLNKLIEKNDLQMMSSLRAIYHDDYRSFDYENADIEVCVPVPCVSEVEGLVRKYGDYTALVSYHYGGYRDMVKTYQRMMSWIEEGQYTYVGPAVENYMVDVISTSIEDEYVTEIILPIEKKSRL